MEKDDKRRKITRIVTAVFSVLFALVLVAGLVVVIFYKSGEVSLKASASTQAPIVEVEEMTGEASDFLYGNSVAWQDDWVAYNGKVYTYNEDTLNFLLMGIDRGGELSTEEDFSTRGPGQADAIFLISLNPKDKTASVIGIPRNSIVKIEVFNDEKSVTDTFYTQICLQYPYAGGGELGLAKMEDRVSEIFYQLPIHGACAISFDAMGVIVDMLGGIDVTIPDDMTAMNPSYVQGSTLSLNKSNVLNYLRYRDEYALGSPTTRLTRQKEFMQAAINVAIEQVKRNPMLVSDIYQAIVPYMNTDITLDETVYLAKQALDYTITSDSFYQLTGEDKKHEFIDSDGSDAYYDNYYLDEDALKDVFMNVFYSQVVLDDSNS
jgi:LCP family protein required for cell wall assembly